ncbi:MAG: DUF1501 domain-containing protein [Bacteroidota bacterium]
MKRRDFLIGCSAGAALMATSRWRLLAGTPWMPSAALPAKDHTLIVLFLRGGADGLQLVAPISDRHYQDARPEGLKVREGEGLDLGEYQGTGFAWHPQARDLKDLFDQKQLAIVHACGLVNGTRSHFDAQDLIERGINRNSGEYDGWMARYLRQVQTNGQLPAVSASGEMARAFEGFGNAAAISSLAEYRLRKVIRAPRFVEALYANDSLMGPAASQTMQTVRYLENALTEREREALEEVGAGYPRHWPAEELSRNLQTVAQLIKMNAGAHVVNVDYGGWDTHERQPYIFGQLVKGLSQSLAAFYRDMEPYRNKITVVVMSEFGRRLRANRSRGTDHGHGNLMLVLGGKVKGGRHYGQWPGLAPDALDKGVDLAVTTDYRNVLANVLRGPLGHQNTGQVFPGFTGYRSMGLFA